uniref:Uncharacterized protein n=1 Tax=Trichuris muris TaxID=70415 RepID=A0A5S6QG88_TRIMR
MFEPGSSLNQCGYNHQENFMRYEDHIIRVLIGLTKTCGTPFRSSFALLRTIIQLEGLQRDSEDEEKFSPAESPRIPPSAATEAVGKFYCSSLARRDANANLKARFHRRGKRPHSAELRCSHRVTFAPGRKLVPEDDLISLVYSTIEMAKGSLPWETCWCPAELAEQKFNTSTKNLLDGLPEELHEIYDHLVSLTYPDPVNYEWINGAVTTMLARLGIKNSSHFDWTRYGTFSERTSLLGRNPKSRR